MRYRQRATELMKMRVSCRSYRREPITEEKKAALVQSLSSFKKSPFGDSAKFLLLEKENHQSRRMKLGTYGMIKDPPSFLVGTIKNSEYAYQSFGYLLEQIILKATELGLGTCWLGYFRKDPFFKEVEPEKGEILPAVSPVGYGSPRKGFYDLMVQKTVKPRRRKGWESLFFHQDMEHPLTKDLAGPYVEPLEMVRIAPSAGNQQPWRIVKEKGRNLFHFYLDHTDSKKRYEKRNLPYIDMGIAICHFELAAWERNLRGTWERILPEKSSLPSDMEYLISWKSAE